MTSQSPASHRARSAPGIGFIGVLIFFLVGQAATWALTPTEVVATAHAQVTNSFALKTPGLSIAAAQNGKIIWSEAFGYADLDAKTPVTSQTQFRIGSVSKPLTAVGLMLLVEKGKIDLDADLHKYLPDFPDKGHVITTRQLGGHLAGIRHYNGLEFLLNEPYASVQDGLKIFASDPLLFPPGTKYSYSSYGYNLISRVMEIGAQQGFLAYMQTNVFDALGLKHTMSDYAGRDLPQRTHFYQLKTGGGFTPAPPVDNSYKWAGGGFLSTPEDLVHFGSALLQPGFLKRESLDTMFTSQKTSDGKNTGYGIGWFVRVDPRGHRFIMHTGGAIGGTSVLVLFPDSGVVLAMVSNCTTSPFDKTHLESITDALGALAKPK